MREKMINKMSNTRQFNGMIRNNEPSDPVKTQDEEKDPAKTQDDEKDPVQTLEQKKEPHYQQSLVM